MKSQKIPRIEDNAIITKIGDMIQTVIQPDTIIRNVDFYKDRSDSVLFSMNGSIYVIEIDKQGTQNFIPVFAGKSPAFVKYDVNSIYVLDGDTLMQVAI